MAVKSKISILQGFDALSSMDPELFFNSGCSSFYLLVSTKANWGLVYPYFYRDVVVFVSDHNSLVFVETTV